MAADKRNALVIAALIASMTLGARLLLWMEPGKPRWQGDATLMAERAVPIHDVVISLAQRSSAEAQLAEPGAESVCVVYPDQPPSWRFAGARLLVYVVQTDAEPLPDRQKEYILAALGSVLQGADHPAAQLDGTLDASGAAREPARDLRSWLASKGFVTQN